MRKKIILFIILMLVTVGFLSGCTNPRDTYNTFSGEFLGYYHDAKTNYSCIHLKTENISNRTYCWWGHYDIVESLVKDETYYFTTFLRVSTTMRSYPFEAKRLVEIRDENNVIIWKTD